MRTMLVFFVLFTGFVARAQDILLGVKAGYNAGTFTGENTAHLTYRSAYHAGIATEINFSDFFSFQVESLYSVAGAKDSNTDYPVQYVSFPLYGRIFPSESFSIDLGGQYAYLIDDTYSLPGNEVNSLGFNTSDYALLTGVSYQFMNRKIFAQIHYVIGVSEVDESGLWNNRLWQISLGYNFL